ncbi:MAG: hypothetical protein J3K34DRAFT_521878 [Monoraphidium minutum]|nr:MAG: hypothetical protein J3K34DRAFT_521878 [Monoraphidium minutum]
MALINGAARRADRRAAAGGSGAAAGGAPTSAALAAAPRWRWSLYAVNWRLALRAQHWGAVLLIGASAAVIGAAHFHVQKTPRVQAALLYDASISKPLVEGVAVPDSTAALWPWLAFLLAILVIEGGLFRGRHSATAAAAAALHFTLACLTSFLIVLAVAEVTKPWTVDCTNPHVAEVNDGRLSFPSGHASNTMSVAWFAGIYMIWSLHIREGSPALTHHVQTINKAAGAWWRRAAREALIALVNVYAIFSVCIGWFIGLTRLYDGRHHAGDILGGFLLAVMLGTFQAIKAIGQYAVIKAELDAASADQIIPPAPLLPLRAPAGTAVAPGAAEQAAAQGPDAAAAQPHYAAPNGGGAAPAPLAAGAQPFVAPAGAAGEAAAGAPAGPDAV